MAELSCEGRSVRDINAQMRNLFADGEDVVVTSPGARHNLGVALLKPGTVSFDGSVGYYCGGLSDGATIRVKGSAGWGLAESMLNGEVTAEGNAGNSAGAAMRGGAVVIHGDSGARTGVSMKGGLIVVGGNCGYMSGFMGQKGTMIICGDAGEGFADSMYETVCFVGGEIRELGNDTVVSELSEEDIQLLGGALDRYLPQRIRSGVPEPGKFRKVVDSGRFEPWDRYDTLKKPCYDLRALHRNLDLMTTIIGYMQEMGWGPYANDHEDANCQFEINWHYSDALTTADRNTFFKWMVRTVAEKNGLWATLMPKPFGHLTGNGTHYHMSLADVTSGENLFLDESDDLGLSPRARWFMGGILEHAGALAAVTSPIVNSYKRLIRSEPHSGATWAPVYVTYGPSNRTQMIRVPGPGRIENRTADDASNPYLACAVALAAGLDGIERQLDPGTANNENLYTLTEAELNDRGIRFLPTSLSEALDCLEQDEVVKAALGETYADYYIGVKREEWREYHRSVSQWELDNYLNVY